MPSSAAEVSVDSTITSINSEIDEVLDLYKGLGKLDMGTSKKKKVGMKVAGLKINKSKVKSENGHQTGGTPKAEKWITEEHLFSSKSKIATMDLHV